MKKRLKNKLIKNASREVEVVQDGVDGLTRMRTLSDPRVVIRKGAMVKIKGAPEIVNGKRIYPVSVRVGKAMQRHWLDEDALDKTKLMQVLRDLGIKV